LKHNLLEPEIKTLLEECQEKLDEIESDLVALGGGGPQRLRALATRVFRGVHSVKAAADYLDHDPLKQLSQAAESVLTEVRDGNIAPSRAHIDLLLSAADRMRLMVAKGQLQPNVKFSQELEKLNALLSGPGIPPAAKAQLLADPPHLRRLRVLVVEDDFSSRLVLQGLLSKYGECHIAVNGREAVEAFRGALASGKNYDLICMDVNMPEMDGREALELIREIELTELGHSSEVRIFMTTAIRDIKTVMASFKAICDAYLLKPIDGRNLEEHLKSFRLIDLEPATP
jgi:two-component system chemotaxis response regulator CheY